MLYTLMANCRAQELEPEAYLVEVIKRLPQGEDEDQTAAQAAVLTPARIAAELRAAEEEIA